MKLASKYSGGFPYKMDSACYFEVTKDGEVVDIPHASSCDLTFMETAHFNTLFKGSRLYATLPGIKYVDMYELDDLEKLSKAFNLTRHTTHTHSFSWSARAFKQDPTLETQWITIKMACGCDLNNRNLEDFSKLLKEQFGWNVLVESGVSHSTQVKYKDTHYTIEVKTRTIRGVTGKFNITKKRYL